MANLKNNTTTMQEILDAVNALPEAGSGGVDVSGVTASPDDVMEGKVIVDADGNEQVGTIPEITAQNVIITPENETTKRYTIPAGRHDGTGSVRIITQSKTVTPSTDEQTITADSGYTLKQVTVDAMSSGVLSSPNISVSSSGVITATSGVSTAGYLPTSASKSGTKSLTTQSGKTVTPSTSTQTAVFSGRYTTGTVYVAGDSNLVSNNIKSGVSIFGVSGSYSGGNKMSIGEVVSGSPSGTTELALSVNTTNLVGFYFYPTLYITRPSSGEKLGSMFYINQGTSDMQYARVTIETSDRTTLSTSALSAILNMNTSNTSILVLTFYYEWLYSFTSYSLLPIYCSGGSLTGNY